MYTGTSLRVAASGYVAIAAIQHTGSRAIVLV